MDKGSWAKQQANSLAHKQLMYALAKADLEAKTKLLHDHQPPSRGEPQ